MSLFPYINNISFLFDCNAVKYVCSFFKYFFVRMQLKISISALQKTVSNPIIFMLGILQQFYSYIRDATSENILACTD